jgi:hypothetical protein
MWSTRDEVVIAYNELVQQFHEDAKNQHLEVSLLTFNGNVYEHMWNEPAEKLEEATCESYVPSGATALRDAVGYAIEKHNAEYDPEAAYLLVIISDGKDNPQNTPQYSPEVLSELIEGCEKSDHWTIAYTGCQKTDLDDSGLNLKKNVALWDNKTSHGAVAGGMANTAAAKKYMRERVFDPECFCPRSDYYDLSGEEGFGEIIPCSDGAADFRTASSDFPTLNNPYVPKGELSDAVFKTDAQNRVMGAGVSYTRPESKLES